MEARLTRSFEFEGKKYEIYTITDVDRIVLKVFVDGQPVNGYSYSTDFLTRIGFWQKYGYDPVSDLLNMAEKDVRDRQWERYCEAVRKVREVEREKSH